MKEYREETITSNRPTGRIDPLQTALQTFKIRQPMARFTAFHRSINCTSNKIVRHALERLLAHYLSLPRAEVQHWRIGRLREALSHFDGVGSVAARELTTIAIARVIDVLPWHRTAYADALRLAQYLALDWGLALRGSAGIAVLPAIVVNMATIFENYARFALSNGLSQLGFDILDGNIGEPHGAERNLFEPFGGAGVNPKVSPDIVIKRGEETVLVIDAKYKPAKPLPERSDTNQLMTYSARYSCAKVAVLHPNVPNNAGSVELIGHVGGTAVYRTGIDLETDRLEEAEQTFVQGVRDIL